MDIGATHQSQWNFGFGEFALQVRNSGFDGGAGVVINRWKDMRGTCSNRDAIVMRDARHFEGHLEAFCSIIDPRQEMAM